MSTFSVDHQIAQRLADLSGIANDLQLVIRASDIFLSSPTAGSEEAIIVSKALASFAIVTYFRTLATGVRSGVSINQIKKLTPDLQLIHQQLKEVRDGYVAHSLNGLERNVVEVALLDDGVSINTLSTQHSRPGTFSKEEISSLKKLAEALHAVVDEESDLEFERVWTFLETMPLNDRNEILSPPKPYSLGIAKRRKLGG